MMTIKDQIIKQLQEVYDPEISINVYDLGLIYDIQINEEERSVEITHTLTSAFCGFADVIAENITIPVGTNGLSSGPITVSTGFTVDVQGEWVIV